MTSEGQIMQALPSGSYLAISHLPSDLEPDKLAESRDRVNRISHQQYTHRSHAEVLRFFDGLQLVEPGLVELRKWRPAVESNRMTPGGADWDANPDPRSGSGDQMTSGSPQRTASAGSR